MPTTVALPSKSRINKCGQYLQDLYSGKTRISDYAEHREAVSVVTDFRAAHAYPMQKMRYGLRSFVRSEGADEAITQRLKRLPRIIRKLDRMENSMLARLEDIGGVRAVLFDGPELERVAAHMVDRWGHQLKRERDYITVPKDIGYRAKHYVFERDGRRVEVQLRTRGQQEWADAVEAIDARRGLNLKDGTGPVDLVGYFEAAGELIYVNEYGLDPDLDLIERFNEARQTVIEAGYYSA